MATGENGCFTQKTAAADSARNSRRRRARRRVRNGKGQVVATLRPSHENRRNRCVFARRGGVGRDAGSQVRPTLPQRARPSSEVSTAATLDFRSAVRGCVRERIRGQKVCIVVPTRNAFASRFSREQFAACDLGPRPYNSPSSLSVLGISSVGTFHAAVVSRRL